MSRRRIAIIGSTGSIGTQALDVISRHPDMFEVELLTANNNAGLLIEQARKFDVNDAVICNEEKYAEVNEALGPGGIKVFAGMQSACDLIAGSNVDLVLVSVIGISGLKPTLAALEAGKAVALANKETLVAAGEIVTGTAARCHAPLIPVDSEHSAIFQCLQGEKSVIEKILLTASGGPFLDSTKEQIANATLGQALRHPRWKMGAKVTIDSASMMNKGFEVIEARWLFGVDPERIEVVVHPESIIHSMVQFADGSVKAQLGSPDMRIPIQYAFSYPQRLYINTERLDFGELKQLTFRKPDLERFPCLALAYEALKKGGNAACVLNAANEMAVGAVLLGKVKFSNIPAIIERTLAETAFAAMPDIESVYAANAEARERASLITNKYSE
ncbi:MAG: 1-deoxy-D-xylulose-5-phosphate reductoisomerase [Bacteroidales bacterium]|jgi:1-deoxy-D-xylulose-5-phosphate reductoisomerase|nr:1-deoxy-D-xylulose-5-phosphate reductoisomerase [Bacteroidales bacterium]MCI2146355.1 1-deoxy-D-xylulose-5-phosphate reductoisomerase [Bacteroidales bacterium]